MIARIRSLLLPALSGKPLHAWFRVSRGLTLGVRAAVLDPDGQIFLVRHTYTPGWHLPGGGVEVGETAEAALVRELAEEARVEPIGAPRLHGVFLNPAASRRDHVLVYVVESFRVAGERPGDWEIAEARFFPVAKLPSQTTPGTRRRLAEIAEGRPPSPVW